MPIYDINWSTEFLINFDRNENYFDELLIEMIFFETTNCVYCSYKINVQNDLCHDLNLL